MALVKKRAVRHVRPPRTTREKPTQKRCPSCPTLIGRDYQWCTTCFLKRRARKHLGSENKWQALRDMFEKQKRRCPYSGTRLVLGLNCNIDHREPKARGGRDRLNNLQWVYTPVNSMKGAMTESEFLALVRVIHEQTKRRRR